MNKSPLINAFVAFLYIAIIALIMDRVGQVANQSSFLVINIMAVISLFTLSAAVMGYLFLCQPIRLYFEGEKRKAVKFFLSTVAIFALITFLMFFILSFGILL